jgi:hypothetical protein
VSAPVVVVNNHLKKDEYLKSVRDINLDHPALLKVQILRAKCRNPLCPKKSFILPISDVSKYARATDRLKKEALDSIVLDNVSTLRTSRRMRRSYNTTGSKSSIDRWKHREAERYEFKEIISQLEFSGILSLDDYKPRRSSSSKPSKGLASIPGPLSLTFGALFLNRYKRSSQAFSSNMITFM